MAVAVLIAQIVLIRDLHEWRRQLDGLKLNCEQQNGLRLTGNEESPVRIFVGPGKDLTITIPNLAKPQLSEALATFLARDKGNPDKVKRALGEASEITLALTTKR